MGIKIEYINTKDNNYPYEIVNLCDRFDAIIYMMLCLHKNNDFIGILQLNKFLSDIKNK